MDLKHLIYEDGVTAVGLIASRFENAKKEISSLVIRYLPPKIYHSKDGGVIKNHE
jgi:hypothetical protein